ncbi:MAG: flagellar M-ring protein FliF [Alphaproteobacteria bacterium]|nr:flagellar M-ring protein FliF [Alphaproteobacteria bacterium]
MNSFLETLKQLGPTRLGIMGAIVLGLMIFFVFISLRVSTPDMKLLYRDLSSIDSGAMAAKLEESQIPYEVSLDGTQINVPSDQVGRARILLAEAGLPNGGSMGYEIFDKQSGFGTTNFVQNINQVRALEGELARTISAMENIRSARVHLVLPQRELFARESRPSSASVFLGLRPGSALDRNQILAIQSLVASAVPELKANNVALIDNAGNLLARGGDDEQNLMGMKAEEMRRSMENQLMQKVEDQLGRIVGFGNVRATVTAEINFDRISTNEELFDPEGQVVRSTQTTEESGLEREPIDENVSVENNLPGITGDLLADQAPTAQNNRLEEVTNFEISRTVRNTVREVGEVKRLSVAVLVDGRYTTNEEGTRVYEPRSQEEIDQISALVKSAVGFDENRGDTVEVVNMQFADVMAGDDLLAEDKLFGFDRADLLDAAEILTVAIMIILVVLLVLQPMVGRLMAPETKDLDDDLEAELLGARPASPALAGPSSDGDFEGDGGGEEELISISGVDGKVKASAVKKVEEIVDNYPAETVSVIRSWMTQEG